MNNLRKKRRLLHVFNEANTIVLCRFVRFLENYFEGYDQTILIIGNPSENYLPQCNLNVLYSNQERKIIRLFSRYDKVFLHSMNLSTREKLQTLFHPTVLDKIAWIAWGGDLYENSVSSASGLIKQIIDYSFKKKIKTFIGIFEPDIDVFRQKYGCRADSYFAPYVTVDYKRHLLFSKDYPKQTIRQKYEQDVPINIMIGHQGNPILHHIEVLNALYRFKDENIHIFLPLNYGDAENIKNVTQHALRCFGDKATVISEKMDINEYYQFLREMDIAVFHTNRQIGLGNIFPLIYLQKKIYLDSNGVMYKYFLSKGITICDSNVLKDIPFSDLISDINTDNSPTFVRKYHNIDDSIDRWEKAFQA